MVHSDEEEHCTWETHMMFFTSNGGCRREENSRKDWSLFSKLLSLVTENLYIYWIKSRAIVYIDCTENQRKISLKSTKKTTEINELRELKCLKKPSQMSSYSH